MASTWCLACLVTVLKVLTSFQTFWKFSQSHVQALPPSSVSGRSRDLLAQCPYEVTQNHSEESYMHTWSLYGIHPTSLLAQNQSYIIYGCCRFSLVFWVVEHINACHEINSHITKS